MTVPDFSRERQTTINPKAGTMLLKMAELSPSRKAFLPVALTGCLCVAMVGTGLFDNVATDLGYDHYAEKVVPGLPDFIAMPFNCLINLAYVVLGLYWLHRDDVALRQGATGLYVKNIFAWMAVIYGPVQWVRLSILTHRSAVLDQWFTLPIFAWVPVWCQTLLGGWRPRTSLTIECLSVASYALTLVHSEGFELALGCHILGAALGGLCVQQRYGDATSMAYMGLALLSCLGFVALKLLDHQLAHWFLFQRLTGHFWSKICDVLQFHYSFCFLTRIDIKK